MTRTATAILSTENLLYNLSIIKNKVKDTKIIAMVKANAYGHGLRSVSSRLEKYVDMLGVASIDEALALRKSGIKIPIVLIEGVFEPEELIIASAEGFQVVFHETVQLKWLNKVGDHNPIKAWLKVNTGMSRLGFKMEEALEHYQTLANNLNIAKPIRIISHFACADDLAHPLNLNQANEFSKITKILQTEFSLCNSAAIFHFPQYHYDFVRPGISLYGASPILGKPAAVLGLKPVMTLKTSIIAVHKLAKGSSVGYSARYNCQEDTTIGIIAFGYGDGYPITSDDGTPVLVKGVRCPIVGRISMDMMTIDLSTCPQAQIGDQVILWGDGLPVEEIASFTKTLNYSILTGVQHRVKFSWTS